MLAVEAGAVSRKVENSCRSDYLQFCPQYNGGTPQLRNCMGQAGRRGSLSPRCLNALIDAGMVPRKTRSAKPSNTPGERISPPRKSSSKLKLKRSKNRSGREQGSER